MSWCRVRVYSIYRYIYRTSGYAYHSCLFTESNGASSHLSFMLFPITTHRLFRDWCMFCHDFVWKLQTHKLLFLNGKFGFRKFAVSLFDKYLHSIESTAIARYDAWNIYPEKRWKLKKKRVIWFGVKMTGRAQRETGRCFPLVDQMKLQITVTNWPAFRYITMHGRNCTTEYKSPLALVIALNESNTQCVVRLRNR